MKTLSENTISFYQKNGYCIVEDILGPDECRRYLEAAEEIACRQEVKYAPAINPDREHPPFRELLCHPNVVHWLEKIQQSKMWALQSMLYFKPPGQMGRDVHQDNHYAQAEQGTYVGTWLALEDTDRENGGLIAYPGSQQEPLLDIVVDEDRAKTNLGGFKNDRGTPCVIPPRYQKAYLAVPAGACVFIHGNLIHGSEENLSPTRFRRIFSGHYIKQGCHFIPGTHAKRTAIDVYTGQEVG